MCEEGYNHASLPADKRGHPHTVICTPTKCLHCRIVNHVCSSKHCTTFLLSLLIFPAHEHFWEMKVECVRIRITTQKQQLVCAVNAFKGLFPHPFTLRDQRSAGVQTCGRTLWLKEIWSPEGVMRLKHELCVLLIAACWRYREVLTPVQRHITIGKTTNMTSSSPSYKLLTKSILGLSSDTPRRQGVLRSSAASCHLTAWRYRHSETFQKHSRCGFSLLTFCAMTAREELNTL